MSYDEQLNMLESVCSSYTDCSLLGHPLSVIEIIFYGKLMICAIKVRKKSR